jgi:hypothetical protein
MKGFRAVFKRELYAFFASPVFYVVGTIFLVLSGYFFYTSTAYFSLVSFQAAQNPYAGREVNLNEMVVKPLLDDMSIVLLLIVPLLTMRLLAEEKKTGTIELLLTYPIRDLEVLMGKYLATLLVIIILLAGTAVNLILLSRFGSLEWGPVLSGYLGLLLMGRRLRLPRSFRLGPDPEPNHRRHRRFRGPPHVLDHRMDRVGGRPGRDPGGGLPFHVGTFGTLFQRGYRHTGFDVLCEFFRLLHLSFPPVPGFTKNPGIGARSEKRG